MHKKTSKNFLQFLFFTESFTPPPHTHTHIIEKLITPNQEIVFKTNQRFSGSSPSETN